MSKTTSKITHSTPRRGIITIAAVLGAGLQGMDTMLAAVALPHIRGSLSLTFEEASWILTSYLIAVAIATPPVSWLGRKFGRKRLFLFVIGGSSNASLYSFEPTHLFISMYLRYLNQQRLD